MKKPLPRRNMKLKVDPEEEKYRINLSYHEVKWTRSPGLKNNNKVEVSGKENAVLKSIKTSGTGRGTLTVTAKIKYIDAASSQEKWENIKAEVYVTTFRPATGASFNAVIPSKGIKLRQRPDAGYSTNTLELNNGNIVKVYGTYNNANGTMWYYVNTGKGGMHKWMYVVQSAIRKEADIKGTLEEYVIKKGGLSQLKGKALEMTVTKNNIKIYASFKYSGVYSSKYDSSSSTLTFKDLFEQGVKEYWCGEFTVFGISGVRLDTIISSSHKEIPVKMIDEVDRSHMNAPLSMNALWSKNTPGRLTLHRKDENPDRPFATEFKWSGAHEFGHILGFKRYYKRTILVCGVHCMNRRAGTGQGAAQRLRLAMPL